MRLITLSRCQPGMKLGKSIYNEKGKVLLVQGTELSARLIKRLGKYHVSTIYIEDEISEGIEIIEAIPPELRFEAENTITEGFYQIAELASNKNLQTMMKSERAIRSFQKIFKDILHSLNGNHQALNLLATTKIHENYVYTHSLNVSIYACQLAIENGLPLKTIEDIGMGAMLHDLGTVFVPLEILNKPGKLTDEEYEQVQSHCELGFEMLRKIHEIPLPVAHCALQHHERMDGSGYPRGLKENEIHRYAKILSVADVFDAVTSPRAYRPSMLPHKGIELLYAGSGTLFDRKQVDLFKEGVAIYPQGLTVVLNDGRSGIVSKYNYHSVGRPVIRVIKDEGNQDVKPYEIDLSTKDYLTVEIVEADALL
ncbi:HD-GYP domain-containing protein [Jeotgalibacillus soli]|uniref:DNA-dirted RNA polymerase n=1 Tax=Jeotgalibacillus soli TaxID=889306 RepID=A0A0C2S5G9_9BACL|nr:HD-GYP domain-containing protein [Jeotgalibacillus soli]KIL49279.1 DNA-dirted RNA polymerase [Jeotgalibacillus soli]